MKTKIVNWIITALAVIGLFVFIGGVGKMDYMTELGIDYPITDTIKTLVIGICMLLPACIRKVIVNG